MPKLIAITFLYADDSLFFRNGKNYDNVMSELQSDLEKLSIWWSFNKLSVNAKKCETIQFGKPKLMKKISKKKLKMSIIEIENKPCIKYLGVKFDDNLNFETNCKDMIQKLYEKLYYYRRIVK